MIRPAEEADRAAIVALHLASWRDSYGIVLPDDVLRDVLPGVLDDKWAPRRFGAGNVTLVAGSGGLLGFVCALIDRDPPLIDNLHVRPGSRGGGIGAALLHRVRADLNARGFAQATLTVLSRNERARAFYAAQGGRDLGAEADVLVGRPVSVRRIRFDL